MTKIKYIYQMTLAEKLKYVSIKSEVKYIMMSEQYDFDHLPIEGEKVLLVPEPLNKNDNKAIAVYNLYLEKMGYLTNKKKINEFVFDCLNGRNPAFGFVKRINTEFAYPIYVLDLKDINDWL